MGASRTLNTTRVMVRIVVLGCAGSGKTSLARRLGERTGAPVISLDDIWQRHWGERDVSVFRTLIRNAHAGDEWISDGNFALTSFDIRLPRATLLIWLERSKLSCIWRVVTRAFKRGEAIESVISPKYSLSSGSLTESTIEAMRLSHGPQVPVRRLAGDGDIENFLSSYCAEDRRRISN